MKFEFFFSVAIYILPDDGLCRKAVFLKFVLLPAIFLYSEILVKYMLLFINPVYKIIPDKNNSYKHLFFSNIAFRFLSCL